MEGFDDSAGNLWIYPTNYPIRDYQLSISKTALFKNTLVVLPTGLGKTFIASVVMYNFYRWYPQGKIVFMAPTKPLVAQQSSACYDIMGIPMEDQAHMTGASTAVKKRQEIWSSKRVFFLTPQVINNDLASGICPASQIKCLVFDEAHKAQGNHVYCQVIQKILPCSKNFRVLALSATPGSNIPAVQQVIKNLLISATEIRSEEALDVREYTHTRTVDKIVVKLCDKILRLKGEYLSVIQILINRLVTNDLLRHKDVNYITKYSLLLARDQFRKVSGMSKSSMGVIEGDFATAISLYHGLDLLLLHGMKSFYIFLKGIMNGEKANTRTKTVLSANEQFCHIYDELSTLYSGSEVNQVGLPKAGKPPADKGSANPPPVCYSHPKFMKVEEVVLAHFRNIKQPDSSTSEPNESKVIVFCQYRDSVQEITELLHRHHPLIRPMQFVGHASPSTDGAGGVANKRNKRFTQKDQLEVVSRFCSGYYNVLIATCVGEEGLDIGAVDLIVCFDSHRSPIRLVQRMGRTGRKRGGRIVMLVTEGKEEKDYSSSVSSRKSISKAITSANNLQYYSNNPRMLPDGVKPTCHKMFITVATLPSKGKVPKKSKVSNATMDSFLTKGKEPTRSTFLTMDQMREYRKNFYISKEEYHEIPKIPWESSCICLEKKRQVEKFAVKSLTDWLPWQCRLQPTKYVEHSDRTKLLQQLLSGSDENNFAPVAPTLPEPLNETPIKVDTVQPEKSCIDRTITQKSENNKHVPDIREFFSKGPVTKKNVKDIASLFTNYIDCPEKLFENFKSDVAAKCLFKPKSPVLSQRKVSVKTEAVEVDVKNVNMVLPLSPVLGSQKYKTPPARKLIKCKTDVLRNANTSFDAKPQINLSCVSETSFHLNLNDTAELLMEDLEFVNHIDRSELEDADQPKKLSDSQDADSPDLETPNFNFTDLSDDELLNAVCDTKTDQCVNVEKESVFKNTLKRKSDCLDTPNNILNGDFFKDTSSQRPKKLKGYIDHLKHISIVELENSVSFNTSGDMFDDNFNVNFDLSSFEKPESKPVVRTPAATDPCEDKMHSNSVFSNYKDCSKQNDSVIEIMDSEVCFDISSDQSGDVPEVIMNDQLKTNLFSFHGDKYATEGHTSTFQLTSFQGNETDGSPLLKKKRCKAKVLESDESFDVSTSRPKSLANLNFEDNSDSEFESEQWPHRKAKRKLLNRSSYGSPINHNLFGKLNNQRQSTPKTSMDKSKPQSSNPASKQDKNRNNPCLFIDNEAEVSGDYDITEDETSSCMDEEMLAFVNDATQLTQHIEPNSGKLPDENAMYLRSLHAKEWEKPGFLNAKTSRAVRNIDVYSQEPEPDVSDYAEDSFCVPLDESDSPVNHGEITLLSQIPDHSTSKPKTRNQVKLFKMKKPKKRRIVVNFDSETSD